MEENTLASFRFKGYSFSYYPKSFEIQRSRNLKVFHVPGQPSVTQDLGFAPREVRGEGEIFGSNWSDQYQQLYDLFLSEDSGLLCLPGIQPFYCHFEEFSVTGKAGPLVLRYKFLFKEDSKRNQSVQQGEWCYSLKGDTLMLIAARYGKTLDQLMKYNPNLIQKELEAGTVIWLS